MEPHNRELGTLENMLGRALGPTESNEVDEDMARAGVEQATEQRPGQRAVMRKFTFSEFHLFVLYLNA